MGETHDTTPTSPPAEDVLTTAEPIMSGQTESGQSPTTLPMGKGLPTGEARKQLMERLIKGVKNL